MKWLLILVALVLLVCPASAWLSGFDYQKDIVLNSTSPTTLTSYQVKFIVWNTTGTDSGQNIYLNGHLTQPTTWNDIRFTTTTDAICDIWIQESNTSAAIIWVEVPYIYTGGTTLRCYYGKSVATAVSDGDATFRFYGTFAVVPLNVDKWVGVGNYTLYNDASGNSVADINENATSGDSSITSIATFSYATGYEQVIRAQMTQYPANLIGLYSNDSYYAYFGASREVNNTWITETRIAPGTGNSQEKVIGNYTGWHIWKIKRSQTGTSCLFTIDNVAVANHTLKVPTASMPMSFRSTAPGGRVIVDWAFTKKYYDPEPYVWYTNPEHANGTPNADFEGSPTFGPTGTTVYFTDLTTGVVDSWNWSFGDGTYSTTQAPNHTYANVGLYNVSLTATNAEGSDTQLKGNYIYIYQGSAAGLAATTPPVMVFIEMLGIFGLVVYALLDNERIYGSVLAGICAALLSFICGYQLMFGLVRADTAVQTVFMDLPLGYFFIFCGISITIMTFAVIVDTVLKGREKR